MSRVKSFVTLWALLVMLASASNAFAGPPKAAGGAFEPNSAAQRRALSGPALLQAAARAHWVAEGRGSRIVYVIFDPNCPYCHIVWKESQAYLKDYQFRWISVGIITPSSPGKAAAILQAKNPPAALRENETRFVRARGKLGGITPLPRKEITSQTLMALKENEAFLKATGGLYVVPKILFLRKNGKVELIEGALDPKDMAAVLAEAAP